MSESTPFPSPLERVLLSQIRRHGEGTQEAITIVRLIHRARALLSEEHNVDALDDDIKDELKRLRGEGLIDVIQPRRLSPSEITAVLTKSGHERLSVLDTQPKVDPEAARRARLEKHVSKLEAQVAALRIEANKANARATAAEDAARRIVPRRGPTPLQVVVVVLSVLALLFSVRAWLASRQPDAPAHVQNVRPLQPGEPTPGTVDNADGAAGPSPFVAVDE